MRVSAGGLLALVVIALPVGPAAAAVPDPDVVRAATVGAASVTAGRAHSCALTTAGRVYCWGANDRGQVGDGQRPDDTAVAHAVTGDAIGIAVQVDAGDEHTCAIDHDGLAYCWGANTAGQLGLGTDPARDEPEPVRVAALDGRTLVEITTGAAHTCAVDDQGAVFCWGDNAAGQLGVPGLTGGTAVPVQVTTASGLTDPVVDVSAGGDTTCAATAEGAAWCWGAGGAGQLGDGSTADRDEPVPVSAGDLPVRQIAAGGDRTCAVDSAGAVSCWGDGTTQPADVDSGATRFRQVAVGLDHRCGLDRDGAAYCWGDNADGQLGDGTTGDATGPQPVTVGAALRDLDAGDRHTCAIDRRGVAYCWGSDARGQLGDGGGGALGVPDEVVGFPRPPAAVTGVTVLALDGGLRVSWRPAGDFGTGAFRSYLALTSQYEASCEVTDPDGGTCDLRGLANGRTYDVVVLTFSTEGNALSSFGVGTPAAPPVSPEPSAPSWPPAPGGGGGELPVTGADPLLLVALGCLLIGLGGVALLVKEQ